MNFGPRDVVGSKGRVGESRHGAGKVGGAGDASHTARLGGSNDMGCISSGFGHRISCRYCCHFVHEDERNSSVEISRFRASSERGHQANGGVRTVITTVSASGINVNLVAGGAGVVASNGEAAILTAAHVVTDGIGWVTGSG